MPRAPGRQQAIRFVVIGLAALLPAMDGLLAATSAQTTGAAQPLNWIVEENAKPGTTAWKIPKSAPTDVQGYANRTSALPGERVRLYVDTSAARFHIALFRLGWYGGKGGRRVWTSRDVDGVEQAPAVILDRTNTVVARWSRSFSFIVRDDWPEGSYLIKLIASTGGQSYVPLVIRNDASTADLVLQQQVATWQAYNQWGGYSLYLGPDHTFQTRSRVVSFDRPYEGRGGGGMLRSLPFIVLVERLGMDVTYWTDVDLHQRPGLLLNHRALVSLSHDEYWSTVMRDAAEDARAAGVNIAFLGADAVFRHIRFSDSRLGVDREIVFYRIRYEDPLNGVNNAEVTVNWRNPPVNDPESALLGAMYQCYGVHADLVVADGDAWVWAGTGLEDGDRIPGLISGEYDRIFPDAPTPSSVQILAHSPVTCHGRPKVADTTYYTARSGAGVFDAGSTGWVDRLECGAPVRSKTCDERVVRVTQNVLVAFAQGPSGRTYPSESNWSTFGYELTAATDP